MKIRLFFVLLIIGFSAQAATPAPRFQLISKPSTVPVISAAEFSVGTTWTWNYYKQDDTNQLYSTEQYRVVDVQNSVVTIEIWTRYAGKTDFTPSARFITDLNLCLKAFNGPYKREVTIEMHSYNNGAWSADGYEMTGTAFEEKFNCNPRVYSVPTQLYSTRFKTVATAWGETELFQQFPRSTSSQIQAFYFLNERGLEGVAYEKAFSENTPSYFLMRLVEWSHVSYVTR